MQFKRIEDFTLEDCRNFLGSNPGGEQADMVKARLFQLSQEKSNQRTSKDKTCYSTNPELERNRVKWIDFDQFLESNKYRAFSCIKIALFIISIVWLTVFFASKHYTSNQFYMYSPYDSIQANKTDGIECLLLKTGIISVRVSNYNEFQPGYNRYGMERNVKFVLFVIPIFILVLYSIFYPLSSPIVKKVYNIEISNQGVKIRAVQDRHGKVGLLKVGKYRLRSILPIKYDAIFHIGGVYVIKENDKYGLFSVNRKKIIAPIKFDSITTYDNDSITLSTNDVRQTFSLEGYRIVE